MCLHDNYDLVLQRCGKKIFPKMIPVLKIKSNCTAQAVPFLILVLLFWFYNSCSTSFMMEFNSFDTDDTHLDLSYQDLEEVPIQYIKDHPNVVSIDLQCNRIRNVPESLLEHLHNVVHLDLSDNKLSSLPNNFGCLINLKELDISGNEIYTIPVSFSKLKNLVWLKMNGNPLTPIMKHIMSVKTWDSDEYYSCARNLVVFMQQVDNAENTFDNSGNPRVNTDLEVLFSRAKTPLDKPNGTRNSNIEAILVEDKNGNYFYVSLGNNLIRLDTFGRSLENVTTEDDISKSDPPQKRTIVSWIKFVAVNIAKYTFIGIPILMLLMSLTCHPKRFQDGLLFLTYPSTKGFLGYVAKAQSYLCNFFSSFSAIFPLDSPLPDTTIWGFIVDNLTNLYHSWYKNWYYQ